MSRLALALADRCGGADLALALEDGGAHLALNVADRAVRNHLALALGHDALSLALAACRGRRALALGHALAACRGKAVKFVLGGEAGRCLHGATTTLGHGELYRAA